MAEVFVPEIQTVVIRYLKHKSIDTTSLEKRKIYITAKKNNILSYMAHHYNIIKIIYVAYYQVIVLENTILNNFVLTTMYILYYLKEIIDNEHIIRNQHIEYSRNFERDYKSKITTDNLNTTIAYIEEIKINKSEFPFLTDVDFVFLEKIKLKFEKLRIGTYIPILKNKDIFFKQPYRDIYKNKFEQYLISEHISPSMIN